MASWLTRTFATHHPYGRFSHASWAKGEWSGLARGLIFSLDQRYRETAFGRSFCLVRPAWAHSCGWKSHRELITTSEAKRNCMRATECGEEAGSEAAG